MFRCLYHLIFVAGPTRDPTKSPTRRPTKEPSPSKSDYYIRASRCFFIFFVPENASNILECDILSLFSDTLGPTPRPTPKPVAAPTPESSPSSDAFCLASDCWEPIGAGLSSTAFGDQLGDKVRLDDSGTRFSVSASVSSESGVENAGFVKVYDVDGRDFVQVGQTLYGFDTGDQVRGVLSGNGRRLVMYTHRRDDNTGRVWIYELQSNRWVEIGKILGEEEGERFGQSVALSTDGDILAVGASFANNKRGAVRIYRERNGSWRQMGAELVGNVQDGKFGWTVALAANALMLVVGQKSDDNGDDSGRSGEIRVFQFNGASANANGSFEQFGTAIQGDGSGDDFGRSVAISASGTIVAAGARYHNGPNGIDSGQIKAYSYFGGGSWFQTPFDGSDIVGDNRQDQLMNIAMNSQGSRIAAGAGLGDSSSGYVRIFDSTGNGWKQVGGKLIGSEPGQRFGSDVSLSPDGTRLLVGSPARDSDAIRGSVQLYELKSN